MTAPAAKLPQRRSACPGLSAPMPTGDGLLVRLTPLGTMPLAAFAALAAAARKYGNGVVEVTARVPDRTPSVGLGPTSILSPNCALSGVDAVYSITRGAAKPAHQHLSHPMPCRLEKENIKKGNPTNLQKRFRRRGGESVKPCSEAAAGDHRLPDHQPIRNRHGKAMIRGKGTSALRPGRR